MAKLTRSHLKLVSSRGAGSPDMPIAIIASITEIEVTVPWYLRIFSPFIPNPFLVTLQEFSEEYTDPLKIPTWTKQCNSISELRACLKWERQRAYSAGRLAVVDYSHKLRSLELEFN